MAITISTYLGREIASGDAATPSAQVTRWASDKLVVVDQDVVDEHGSTEFTVALRDADAATDGRRNPRIRIGLYVKPGSDGVVQYNTSIRLFTEVKHDDGTTISFRDASFVVACTTYWQPGGSALERFAILAAQMLKYDLDSDSGLESLSAMLNEGVATLVGVGKTYAGSTFP
jgi:hypothetical protein